MTTPPVPAEDLFLNVRKAYRLLHDYQQMVVDAVRYIGSQLDIEPNGGCARFAGDAKGGWRYLQTPSWDWLPMIVWEFHFVTAIRENQRISLSIFIVSDTGFFEADNEAIDRAEVSAFAPADRSTSRVVFMLRPGPFDNFPFMENKQEMRGFVKDGRLPADLKDQGAVGESHDMSCLLNEASADIIVERILALAKQHSMPLERVFKPSQS